MLARRLVNGVLFSTPFSAARVVPASDSHLLTCQRTLLGKPQAVFPTTRKAESICSGMKQYFNLPHKVIPKG